MCIDKPCLLVLLSAPPEAPILSFQHDGNVSRLVLGLCYIAVLPLMPSCVMFLLKDPFRSSRVSVLYTVPPSPEFYRLFFKP